MIKQCISFLLLLYFLPLDAAFPNFSFYYYRYDTSHFWNRSGKKMPTHNRFKQDLFQVFSCYRASSYDCLSVQGSYSKIDERLNGKTYGFGDVELGWQRYLGEIKTHQIFGQVIGIIPAGATQSCLRYGRFGTEANLLCTKDFCLWNRFGFYDVQIGYRAYSGFPSDQLRAHLLVGYQIFPKILLEAWTRVEYGLFNGRKGPFHNLVLFNPNYRLVRVYLMGYYEFYRDCYFTLGVFKHIWGRNVGTGGGLMAGTWLEF